MMSEITIVWVVWPFFAGFVCYLFPKLDRYIALLVALCSLGYGINRVLSPMSINLNLIDNFGVSLWIDSLSGYFILNNAIVTLGVILYCWQSGKTAFFYTQMIILHGSVNAIFICADLISFYVALEVISIAAFLLIAYPRTEKSIWVALRYLFISNTAMLFYLLGAILVYQGEQSFALTALETASTEALALIWLGLLTKGGIFVSGFWLPLTHAEAETPVSALLSGTVIKTGVFPLLRCAQIVEEVEPFVGIFSVGTALIGVSYGIFEKDTKRLLALSTISQLGLILASPISAGFYALSHGLAKTALFLSVGNLPTRDLDKLRFQIIPTPIAIGIVVAGLSLSGFPLLAGFEAKTYTLKQLIPWQEIALNIAAVGTAVIMAKLIFLPLISSLNPKQGNDSLDKPEMKKEKKITLGFCLAIALLVTGLIVGNIVYLQAYTLASITKSLLIIAIGWLVYWLILSKVNLKLPKVLEEFDHLIGTMSLLLILLFSLVWI